MKVVGLDLSITAPGVAVLDDAAITVNVYKSKPLGPTLHDRDRRLALLLADVVEHLAHANLVVVEAPPYGHTPANGSAHDRAGFWWRVVHAAQLTGAHVVEVSPTSLKKYATGKGNASKEEVMWKVASEWPGVDAHDDNGCDALWLAAMGRAHLDPDTALHSVTKARAAVLKSVAW